MNFTETHKTFGDIKENSVVQIEYQKTAECKEILAINPDCASCTKIINWPDKVIIQYTSSTIPPQVLQNGGTQQSVERGATVEFRDGSSERLYFYGHVTK